MCYIMIRNILGDVMKSVRLLDGLGPTGGNCDDIRKSIGSFHEGYIGDIPDDFYDDDYEDSGIFFNIGRLLLFFISSMISIFTLRFLFKMISKRFR